MLKSKRYITIIIIFYTPFCTVYNLTSKNFNLLRNLNESICVLI